MRAADPDDLDFFANPGWEGVLASLRKLEADLLFRAAKSDEDAHLLCRGRWEGAQQAIAHLERLLRPSTKH